jgi:hypothetical protein
MLVIQPILTEHVLWAKHSQELGTWQWQARGKWLLS